VDESTRWTPALELNRAFYDEAVASLLDGIPHAAARAGWGSEILGFDTARSTDHGWGPQLQVFVVAEHVDAAQAAVDSGLPDTFHGWPVEYGWDAVPVRHHVYVSTLGTWLVGRLGFDALQGIDAVDWLTTSQQSLLGVTRGAVYHDDTGELTKVRALLAWYPDDVWLWLLACQWRRIAQEEAFVGRTAEVGDELGSQVVAARVARDLMRLWFLLARTTRRIRSGSARRSRNSKAAPRWRSVLATPSQRATTRHAKQPSCAPTRSSRAATTNSVSPIRSIPRCGSTTGVRSGSCCATASPTPVSPLSGTRHCVNYRS
jgi:hypothetical protein